jgi:hypothetical protein
MDDCGTISVERTKVTALNPIFFLIYCCFNNMETSSAMSMKNDKSGLM